jgi:hypothetical protein
VHKGGCVLEGTDRFWRSALAELSWQTPIATIINLIITFFAVLHSCFAIVQRGTVWPHVLIHPCIQGLFVKDPGIFWLHDSTKNYN